MSYISELNKLLDVLKKIGVKPFYDEDCNTIRIYKMIDAEALEQLKASPILYDWEYEYEYSYDEMDFDYDCFSCTCLYLLADDDED